MLRRSLAGALQVVSTSGFSAGFPSVFSGVGPLVAVRGLKDTTHIVGLKVDPNARENVIAKSSEVLRALEGIPSSAQYRKDTEAIYRSFINAAKDQNLSDEEVEAAVGRGQLEELIQMGKEELRLIPILKAGKPWEVPAGHKVVFKYPLPASALPKPPAPPPPGPPPPPPPPPPKK